MKIFTSIRSFFTQTIQVAKTSLPSANIKFNKAFSVSWNF
jgi:hypothetical protein